MNRRMWCRCILEVQIRFGEVSARRIRFAGADPFEPGRELFKLERGQTGITERPVPTRVLRVN
jgi:hypothetical protein